MICFQLLSLTTFLQYWFYKGRVIYWLWFAFNFYLWQRSYNFSEHKADKLPVVICFQLLSLTTFLQWGFCIYSDNQCCDLLSTFIFDNVLTMMVGHIVLLWRLWFAFNFYLWQRSYNLCFFLILNFLVVICFQLLSLTTFLQFVAAQAIQGLGCDLLSTFIFDNVLTIWYE